MTMLRRIADWPPDPWVIEEGLRRERERARDERPHLEVPAAYYEPEPEREEAPAGNVIIIDL